MDAGDYLSLRLQQITIDEHYARLYMPAMIMHEKLQHHESAGSSSLELPPTYTASEQQMLRQALSNTPFEVFRHKAFTRDDSEEHVAKQLRREHEDRMHQVYHIID